VLKVHPLPRLRIQIPFERSFTQNEFLLLKRGFVAESMEDRWHIFFKDPWMTFVRSWTGFCVYKVRLEGSDKGCKIVQAFASRDLKQYGGTDAREDVEMLSFLIDHLLLDRDQITRP
jgi:hypothetical protein